MSRRLYGFTPEGFNLISGTVEATQAAYPLRPELAESLYVLYQATHDDSWYVFSHMNSLSLCILIIVICRLEFGLDIIHSIQNTTKTVAFSHTFFKNTLLLYLTFFSDVAMQLYLMFNFIPSRMPWSRSSLPRR